jgi:hypothetical protein
VKKSPKQTPKACHIDRLLIDFLCALLWTNLQSVFNVLFITKFFFCNVSIYTKLLYKQINKHRLEAIIHPHITLGHGLGKSVLVFSHL